MTPHRRPVHTLREAVASFLETSGLARQTLADQIGRAWLDIVGAEVAAHTKLARTIHGGVLRVEVDSATLMGELAGFRRPALLKGLQERVRRKHIEEIRFELSSGT